MAGFRDAGPWWEMFVLSREHGDWSTALPEQMTPQQFAAAVLSGLPPAEREHVIRQAAREVGLRVLTAEQAETILAVVDEDGNEPVIDDYADLYAMAVAALRGGEEMRRG
jgi:hypothetical protein